MQSKSQNGAGKTIRLLKFRIVWVALFLFLKLSLSFSQVKISDSAKVIVGAERMKEYLPMLQGKNVALVINQTSRIGRTLLIDTLLDSGVAIKKITGIIRNATAELNSIS